MDTETPLQKGARNVAFMKQVLDDNELKQKWNQINYFKGSAFDLVVILVLHPIL